MSALVRCRCNARCYIPTAGDRLRARNMSDPAKWSPPPGRHVVLANPTERGALVLLRSSLTDARYTVLVRPRVRAPSPSHSLQLPECRHRWHRGALPTILSECTVVALRTTLGELRLDLGTALGRTTDDDSYLVVSNVTTQSVCEFAVGVEDVRGETGRDSSCSLRVSKLEYRRARCGGFDAIHEYVDAWDRGESTVAVPDHDEYRRRRVSLCVARGTVAELQSQLGVVRLPAATELAVTVSLEEQPILRIVPRCPSRRLALEVTMQIESAVARRGVLGSRGGDPRRGGQRSQKTEHAGPVDQLIDRLGT